MLNYCANRVKACRVEDMSKQAKSIDLYKQAMELRMIADVNLRESGYAPYTDEQLAAGIWTMTDAEFNEALREVSESAYDRGFTDCNQEYRKQAEDLTYPIMRTNPYGAPDRIKP